MPVQDITTTPLTIHAAMPQAYQDILSHQAQEFLIELHQRFNHRRLQLLENRKLKQKEIDKGKLPSFLNSTAHIRRAEWTVDPVPQDLKDRRVEITGPVDRKMIINALNSGAKVFMADFEDSNCPSWTNNMDGQVNLRDAINKTISYVHPDKNKTYRLNDTIATLMVRPRGWHLEERNFTYQGELMSGSLVDFGLYFFTNAQQLIENGSGPYFYLPKLENHLEARLWNDVFVFAQHYLGIPQGCIKATVLVETILASFELNEILYELRHHSAGLNCGRWDYIFSYIKKLKNHKQYILPDRGQVTMSTHFMSSYSQLVIKTCHKRGVHAMGGMSAFIPIKNDLVANSAAISKVRNDKIIEARNGHDGTWVAHPGLVQTAMEVFNEHMPEANQIRNLRTDVEVAAEDLLKNPKGTITEEGLRQNINVGILYIESWLRGVGAAAIYNLMEDAATAEISRTQVWQWLQNASTLEDGRTVDKELYQDIKQEEIEKIKKYIGAEKFVNGKFVEAISLFDDLVLQTEYIEFLTLPAYDLI